MPTLLLFTSKYKSLMSYIVSMSLLTHFMVVNVSNPIVSGHQAPLLKVRDDSGEVSKIKWSGLAVWFLVVKSSLHLLEKLAKWPHASNVNNNNNKQTNKQNLDWSLCINCTNPQDVFNWHWSEIYYTWKGYVFFVCDRETILVAEKSSSLPCMRAMNGRTDMHLHMNRLSLRDKFWSSKTFKKITNPFRGQYGIYLKLMKENHKITTCDRLALETPLGSRPIVHAQKSPWTLIGCGTCG